jgi:hypothetical protein
MVSCTLNTRLSRECLTSSNHEQTNSREQTPPWEADSHSSIYRTKCHERRKVRKVLLRVRVVRFIWVANSACSNTKHAQGNTQRQCSNLKTAYDVTWWHTLAVSGRVLVVAFQLEQNFTCFLSLVKTVCNYVRTELRNGWMGRSNTCTLHVLLLG